MNTSGYGARTLKKTISVYTNDHQHPVSGLTVTGEVKRLAIVTPSRVALNGEVGENLRIAVKISPVSKGLFESIAAKADRGEHIRLTLTEEKGTTGDKIYTLVVENTKITAGQFHDIIRLRTTDKIQKEILIPVSGNIRPLQIAAVQPRHLVLNGPAGKSIKGVVTIVPRDGYPFSIIETKAHSGTFIKWDLQESVNSGKKIYTLTVENLKTEKGRYYDGIFLKTDRKDLPEIRISVSGRITD
ncbi:MAG: hypothetical protein K9N21_14240 [Deltaproteobacteria bacterium]|nr:hypothetical protein [Deltaproteobacteria bacterium]